jgi:hypothetical protein
MSYEVMLQISDPKEMDDLALILLHNGYEVYYNDDAKGNLCIGTIYPEFVVGHP